jgi:tyrosine-protein kinase Etk/Wzc
VRYYQKDSHDDMSNLESIELREGDSQSLKPKDDTTESNDIDVLDVFLVLARGRRTILVITAACMFLAALVACLMRPSFTASATILPPQQQQQSILASMGGQAGPLAALGGGAASIFKNPADLYVGILESRTIADQLIETFKLKSVYKAKTLEDARTKLAGNSTIEAAKDGLISITVTDHDPKRASELANAYIDALHQLNSTLAITEAAQRRVFFDQELANEKDALAKAEEDLKATQQKTGLIQLSGQSQEIIQNIAQTRAEISSREVQLQALKTFATEQNPEAIQVQEEINTLRGQLASLENSQRRMLPGDINVSAGQVPEATLEYERKFREVHYHEALYELLTNQYEAARIDEAKSAPLIQVVDRAVPPEKKSGPHRILIALAAGALGFIGACICVLLRNGYRRLKQVPANLVRLQELRDTLRARG